MISKKELQRWLDAIDGDFVALDDGGNELHEVQDGAATGNYLEIGYLPDDGNGGH